MEKRFLSLVLAIAFFLSTTFVLKGQQLFRTGKVKAKTATYIIKEVGNGVVIHNSVNTFVNQKPTRNPDEIAMSGFSLKEAQRQINSALKTALSQEQRIRLQNQGTIVLTLLTRDNGKIEDVTFQFMNGSQMTIFDIEKFESEIKKLRIPVKEASASKGINFIPFVFIVNVKNLVS